MRPVRWKKLRPHLLIGVGGFVGANTRFLTYSWAAATFHSSFPIGTLFINLSGSFVIGLIGALLALSLVPVPHVWRFLVSIGLVGGYTTFSAFEDESYNLLQNGMWGTMVGYILASIVGGLIGVRVGIIVVTALRRARS